MSRGIYLFMWAYQESFRISVQTLIRDVLKELGAEGNAEVFLVGARGQKVKIEMRYALSQKMEDGLFQYLEDY